MQEEEFFRSETIVITRTLARFGGASFSISNISLVRLAYEKKMSAIAVISIVLGAIALFIGISQPSYDESRSAVVGVGVVLLIIAAVVQKFWPKKEYTFSLKANSGDGHSFTIENSDFATKVKVAIEEAIALRT